MELAELVGRDYTAVSRQFTKLGNLGLVRCCPSPDDRRICAAIVTDAGRTMTAALDAARQTQINPHFKFRSN